MNLSPNDYLRAYSDFQDDMERKVAAVVRRVYASSGYGRSGADPTEARDALAGALTGLVTTYGPTAESFGMFLFQEMTGERPAAAAVPIVEAAAATTASVYGIIEKFGDPLAILPGSMNRHVMNRARGAIHASAAGTPEIAYARVPNYRGQREGKGPCEFCIVLASRGPVYASDVTAGARGTGNEYHDDCYCVPTLMTKANPDDPTDFGNPDEWPKGYTPDRLYKEIYDPSHEYLDTIKDVTRKIRAKDPTFPLGR